MKRVFVVCEGQTEETFVRDVLAPAFYPLNINLIQRMISTSPGHQGGGLSYDRVRRFLRNTLREDRTATVTSLFDLYKLDTRFPEYASAMGKPLDQKLATLAKAFHEDIVGLVNCPPEQFIPFLQPYEFEALLFSDITTLAQVEQNWSTASLALQAIRDNAESPEHINDNPRTKPAAHRERYLQRPDYRKRLHGPIAAQRIGLPKIEKECKYFGAWVAQLRSL